MLAPSCTRRTRLCGFLLAALTTSLLCAPDQALGAAPGATAASASTDVVGSTTEEREGDGDVSGLTARLGGLQLEDDLEDGSEFREPERRVRIVNSGHGDAKWIKKPTPRRPSWFAQLPPGVPESVAAFAGVDVQGGAGEGQVARVGDGKKLVDRLDVLGLLSTVRNPDEKWLDAPWRNVILATDNWFRARWEALNANLVGGDQTQYRGLLDVTNPLLGETTGYGRGGPQMQARLSTQQGQYNGTTTTISPAIREIPAQFRPGAQVRVKPWGFFGTRTANEMSDFLEEVDGAEDPQLDSLMLLRMRGRSTFVRWSAYLEQYADAEKTGEVVQFVPGGGGGAGPPSYVVRFPLPALPWLEESAKMWGASPFFVRGTDVAEDAGNNVGNEEEVPPGGWRLTRRGAERLPAGQNELLLEVPYNQLYVDVEAQLSTYVCGGAELYVEGQNGQNPFVAGVAEALRYE